MDNVTTTFWSVNLNPAGTKSAVTSNGYFINIGHTHCLLMNDTFLFAFLVIYCVLHKKIFFLNNFKKLSFFKSKVNRIITNLKCLLTYKRKILGGKQYKKLI